MAVLPPRPVIRAAWAIHRAMVRLSGGRMGLSAAKVDKEGLAQLTTIGRRSGEQRVVMIGYFNDGSDYVTMAMNGWDASDPAWWLNLQANPNAELLTSTGTVQVVGRAATGDDHDRLWNRWRELDHNVDKFSDRRAETQVVVLSPG